MSVGVLCMYILVTKKQSAHQQIPKAEFDNDYNRSFPDTAIKQFTTIIVKMKVS